MRTGTCVSSITAATGGITVIWTSRYRSGGREVNRMPFLKEKQDFRGKKYDVDLILLHVRDIILGNKYCPETLPELVEAYTNLLEVRLDME